VRTYVSLDLPDSAGGGHGALGAGPSRRRAPYREWALALSDRGAHDGARQVLLAGRKALGQPTAFAIELAALSEQTGDWEGAAREWGTVVTTSPAQAQIAATQLAAAPADQRGARRSLPHRTGCGTAAARLAAELVLDGVTRALVDRARINT